MIERQPTPEPQERAEEVLDKKSRIRKVGATLALGASLFGVVASPGSEAVAVPDGQESSISANFEGVSANANQSDGEELNMTERGAAEQASRQYTREEKEAFVDRMVDAVMNGDYGNGDERRTNIEAMGLNYDALQQIVRERAAPPENRTLNTKAVEAWKNAQEFEGIAEKTRALGNGNLTPNFLASPSWTPNQPGIRLDAASALELMNAAFKEEFGSNIYITDTYRSFDAQVRVKANKGRLAAKPGTSNHGWGTAIDIGLDYSEKADRHTYTGNQNRWMQENAHKFGWNLPDWAQPNGSKPEPWHWEFEGVPKPSEAMMAEYNTAKEEVSAETDPALIDAVFADGGTAAIEATQKADEAEFEAQLADFERTRQEVFAELNYWLEREADNPDNVRIIKGRLEYWENMTLDGYRDYVASAKHRQEAAEQQTAEQ